MGDALLRIEGITKRYGDLLAVDGLTLAVHRGEILGFLGPNGAGKTTAIRMMCGLLPPDGGRVLVGDQPLDRGARRRLGVCPQELVIWERLTCIEQLELMGTMYGMHAADARGRGGRLLEELGLADKRDAQSRTLSGGMKRRLNVALALVHDPDVVLLDEPEAGLDPQSRVLVREYIRALAVKKAVVLTTHDMDEADRLSHRLAILDHGKILSLDTPAALKRKAGEGVVDNERPGPAKPGQVGEPSHGSGSSIVEVTLTGAPPEGLSKAVSALPGVTEATLHGAVVIVRAPGAAALVPALLEAVQAAGGEPAEVRLREPTLEDVFLQLTGRSLRE